MKISTCNKPRCKNEIELDDSFENSQSGKSLGISIVGYCPKHWEEIHHHYDIMTKLIPKYNKKKLKNKFGKVKQFYHHSDLSNYLYQYDRKEYNRLLKL